jgi:hypothetical protein
MDTMRAMISIFAALRPFVVSLGKTQPISDPDAAQIALQQESRGRTAAWQIKKQGFKRRKTSSSLKLRLGRRTLR